MISILLACLAVASLFALASRALFPKKIVEEAPLASLSLLLAGIEIFDQAALHAGNEYELYRHLTLALEGFLPAALLWYSFSFARREPARALSFRGGLLIALAVLFPGTVLLLPLEYFFYSPDFQTEHMLFLGGIGYWFYLGVVFSCVTALMNIEGTLSSCTGSDRSKIKYEVIGMGSIIAVLILYFSEGLLYRSINADLTPVRSGVIILAACLVLSSKLLRGGSVRVTVSRSVLFRSITLLAVGIYLIILALAGEGLKYFNLPLARYLAIFLAFAGGIALLLMLLSERFQRNVKVIITKHFFSQKHDYRQTWLDLTRKLSACSTLAALKEGIPAAFRDIFGLRSASLYLLEPGSGVYVRSGFSSSPAMCRISPALLTYLRDRNRVWNPADREYAPTPEEAAFVKDARAILVVPLCCNQQVEGLVVFGRPLSQEPFIFEDYDLMKIIARQSALLLSNVRMSQELIEAREVAAMARVSSFVVHDLKNLTHTLSLMMDNAEEHMGNVEFQYDMMTTIRHTLATMKGLTQKLKGGLRNRGAGRGEATDIRNMCRTVIEEFARTRPQALLLFKGESAACSIDEDELRKVIINLVQNGLDAAGEGGTITVETGMGGSHAFVKVSDNGSGMAEDFMEHQLFKPFRSTKSTGLGIGLYHCKQIIESSGGTIFAMSEVGKGSTFIIEMPVPDRSLSIAA